MRSADIVSWVILAALVLGLLTTAPGPTPVLLAFTAWVGGLVTGRIYRRALDERRRAPSSRS